MKESLFYNTLDSVMIRSKRSLCANYPGSKILSIGSFGYNLQCDFCQNWEISQQFSEYPDTYRLMISEECMLFYEPISK